MIARIWQAAATADGAEAYAEHFEKRVLPELQSLDGHCGAYLLRRENGGGLVDLQVVSLWASLEAVRDFAGDDLETAVVEPEAQAVLESYGHTVTHHTVVFDTT